jgi:hypothetical protein
VASPVPIERSDSFKRQYDKLDGVLRERVEKTIRKITENPNLPGLNLERVQGASRNVRSVRVNRKYRIILERLDSAGLRLLTIANHEPAYREGVQYWLSFDSKDQIRPDEFERLNMFEPYKSPYNIHDQLPQIIRDSNLSREYEQVGSYVARLIAQTVEGGTDGKARIELAQHQGGRINVIPSDVEGVCHEVLVAFCFDGDSFNDRLREIAYHAGIDCPDTKLVVLVTSQWINKDWKKNHEKAFANLNAKVVIYFAGLGAMTRIA